MADNSNNSSAKPRNWRDRVGVKGGMPKLADEFKTESAHGAPARPAATTKANARRPAPKPSPRPVSQPAPMAPRRPSATATRAAPKPAGATPGPASPPGANAASDRSSAFASRLRAQREAAEVLAKKRADETRSRLAGADSSTNGPKFSFADEELNAAAHETPPQSPARPPVAGPSVARPQTQSDAQNSGVPPRTSAQASQPARAGRPGRAGQLANQPPVSSPYQPSDAFRQTRGFRDYNERPAQPLAPPAAHDRYAEAPAAGQGAYAPPANGGYRTPQPRTPYYEDDVSDDLFDDGQQSARSAPPRAGASDYSAAYRDYDEAFEYEEEPRSRGGVWIFVVLMLIVVAAIAAGAYWFINYGTKIGTDTPAAGNVPTVTAPEQPVKVAPKPEDPTPVPGAPVRRKKIYDRILGNQTLEPEKLVPSEETPQAPPLPVVPDAAPAGDAPLSVQPLPLPLPPPPTLPGVQGGLQENVPGAVSAKSNRVASLTPDSVVPGAGKTGQTIIGPTAATSKSSTIQAGGQQAPLVLPAIPAPDQTGTTRQPTASDTASPALPALPATPPATTPANTPPGTLAAPPLPRKKPVAVIARARQAAQQARLAALTRTVAPAPLVPLVPRQPLAGGGPVQLTPGSSGSQNFNAQPPGHPAQAAPTQVVPGQAAPAPRQPNTNIASLPRAIQSSPAPQPTAPPAAGGSGYVLQMSSFRNRDAATAEYRRLISRHPSILRGLSPEIREADLGASGKFYKLRLGAVPSRGQAAQLCNALIAAGEKDCLVRNR